MGTVHRFHDPDDYDRVRRRIKRLYREGRTVIMPRAGRRLTRMRCSVLDLQHVVSKGLVVGHRVTRGRWQYTIRADRLLSRVAACDVEVERALVFVRIVR